MRYSIEINQTVGALCADCETKPTPEGPVGYRDGQPVCDLCLLSGSKNLGMMLTLTCFIRSHTQIAKQGPAPLRLLDLRFLSAFFFLYESTADWPSREPVRLDHLVEPSEDGALVDLILMGSLLGFDDDDPSKH